MSWINQYTATSLHSLTWSGNGDVPDGGGYDNTILQAAEFSDPKYYRFNSSSPGLKLIENYTQGNLTGYSWDIFDTLGIQAWEDPDATGVYDFNIYTAAGYKGVNNGSYGFYNFAGHSSPLWTEPQGLVQSNTGNCLVNSLPWIPGGVDDHITVYGKYKTGIYVFGPGGDKTDPNNTWQADANVVGTGWFGDKTPRYHPTKVFTFDGGQQLSVINGEQIYTGGSAFSVVKDIYYDWATRDGSLVLGAGGWRRYDTREATENSYRGWEQWSAASHVGIAVIGQPASYADAIGTSGASVVSWRNDKFTGQANWAGGRGSYLEYSWKELDDTRGKTYTFSVYARFSGSDMTGFNLNGNDRFQVELGSWKGIRDSSNYEYSSTPLTETWRRYSVRWRNESTWSFTDNDPLDANVLSVRLGLGDHTNTWPTNTKLLLASPQVNLGEDVQPYSLDPGGAYESGSFISVVHSIPTGALVYKNKLDYYAGGNTGTASTDIITGVGAPIIGDPGSTWVSMAHQNWPGNLSDGGLNYYTENTNDGSLDSTLGNYINPWTSGCTIDIVSGQNDPFGGIQASKITKLQNSVGAAGIYSIIDLGEPLEGAYTFSVYAKPSKHTMVQTGHYTGADDSHILDSRFTSTPTIGVFAFPVHPLADVNLISGYVYGQATKFSLHGPTAAIDGGFNEHVEEVLGLAECSNISTQSRYGDLFHFGSGNNAIWNGETGNLTSDGYIRLSTTVYAMPKYEGSTHAELTQDYKNFMLDGINYGRAQEGVRFSKFVSNQPHANDGGFMWSGLTPPPTTKMVVGVFMANMHLGQESPNNHHYTGFMDEWATNLGTWPSDFLMPNDEPAHFGSDNTSPTRPNYNPDLAGLYKYNLVDGAAGRVRAKHNWASGDSIMISHAQLERGVHTNEFSVHGMTNTNQLGFKDLFISYNDGSIDGSTSTDRWKDYHPANPNISHPFYKTYSLSPGPGFQFNHGNYQQHGGKFINKFPPHIADSPITSFVTGQQTIENAVINLDYRASHPTGHILPSYTTSNLGPRGTKTGVILAGINDIRVANGPHGVCSQGIWIDRGYDFAFIEISPWGIRVHSSADWYTRDNYIPPSEVGNILDNLTIDLNYPNITLTRKSDNYTTTVKNAFVSRYNVTHLGAACPGDTVASRIYNSELIPFYDRINPIGGDELTWTGVMRSGWPNYSTNQISQALPTGFQPYIALGCIPATGTYVTKEYADGNPQNTGSYIKGEASFEDKTYSLAAYPPKAGTYMTEPGSLNKTLSPIDVSNFSDGVFDVYGRSGIAGFVGKIDWDNAKIDYKNLIGSTKGTREYSSDTFTAYTQPFYPPHDIGSWGSCAFHWKSLISDMYLVDSNDYHGVVYIYPQIAVPNGYVDPDYGYAFDWQTHTELYVYVSGGNVYSSTDGYPGTSPTSNSLFQSVQVPLTLSTLPLNTPEIALSGSNTWSGSTSGQQSMSANAIRFMAVAYGGVYNQQAGSVAELDRINIAIEMSSHNGFLGYSPSQYPCDIVPAWKPATVPKDIYAVIDLSEYYSTPPPAGITDFLYLNNASGNSSAASGQIVHQGYTETVSYVTGHSAGYGLTGTDSIYNGTAWRNYIQTDTVSGLWRSYTTHVVPMTDGIFQGELDDSFKPYISSDTLTGFSGIASCVFGQTPYEDPDGNTTNLQYVTVQRFENDTDNTILTNRFAGGNIPLDKSIGFEHTGLFITGDYANNNNYGIIEGNIEISRGPGVLVSCQVSNNKIYERFLNGEDYRTLSPFKLAFPLTGNYSAYPKVAYNVAYSVLPRVAKVVELDSDQWGPWKDIVEHHSYTEFGVLDLSGYISDQSYVSLSHSGDLKLWPVGLEEKHNLSGDTSWSGFSGLYNVGYEPYDRTSFVFEGWFRPAGIIENYYGDADAWTGYIPQGNLFIATGVAGRGLHIQLNESGHITADIDLSIDTGAFGHPQFGLGRPYADIGWDDEGRYVDIEDNIFDTYEPVHLSSNMAGVKWGNWNHIGIILDTKALGDFYNGSNQPNFPSHTGKILHGARSSKVLMTLNGYVLDVQDVGISPYALTGASENDLFVGHSGGYNDAWPKMPRFYYSTTDMNAVLCSGVVGDMDLVRWGYRANSDVVTDLCTKGSKTMPPMFRPYDSPKVPKPDSGSFDHYEFAHIYPFDEPQYYKGWDRGYADQPALVYRRRNLGDELNAYHISNRELLIATDTGPKGRDCLRIGPQTNIQIPYCSYDERIFNGTGSSSSFGHYVAKVDDGDHLFYDGHWTGAGPLYSGLSDWAAGLTGSGPLTGEHGHISSNSSIRLGGFFKLNTLPISGVNTDGTYGQNIMELISCDGSEYVRDDLGKKTISTTEDYYYGVGDHAYLGVNHSGHITVGSLVGNDVDHIGGHGPFMYTSRVLETGEWYHLGAEFRLGSGVPSAGISIYLNGALLTHHSVTVNSGVGHPIGYNGELGISRSKSSSTDYYGGYGKHMRSRFVIGGQVKGGTASSVFNEFYPYGDVSVADVVVGYDILEGSQWSWLDLAQTGGQYLSGIADIGFIPPNYIINNVVGTGNDPASAYYTGIMHYPATTNESAGFTPLNITANEGYDFEGFKYGAIVLNGDSTFFTAQSYYAVYEDDNSEEVLGGEASPIQIANRVPSEGVNLALLSVREWDTNSNVTRLDLSEYNVDNITSLIHGEYYLDNLSGFVSTNASGNTMTGVITVTPQVDSNEIRVSSYPLYDNISNSHNMGFFMHLLGKGGKNIKLDGAFPHKEAESDYTKYHYNLNKVKESVRVTTKQDISMPFGMFPHSLIISPYPPNVFENATGNLIDQIKSGIFGWGTGAVLTDYSNPDGEFTAMLIAERQSIGATVFISYPSITISGSNTAFEYDRTINLEDSEVYNPIPTMYQLDDDVAQIYGFIENKSLDSAWTLTQATPSEDYRVLVWNANLTGAEIQGNTELS